MDRLEGLRREERVAAVAVERATGARAVAHDVGGRQGAVDIMLSYPDGRIAALEVTTTAGEGVRQRDALLADRDHRLPNPGRWAWSATIGSPASFPRLLECYERVILLCEQWGVREPASLPREVLAADPELLWLGKSDVSMHGSPELPAVDGDRVRPFWVLPQGGGGAVDEGLEGLPTEVTDMLRRPAVGRRLAKLLRTEAHERHLFVAIGVGGIGISQYLAMMDHPERLPTVAPKVPSGISHLWLTTGYGTVVFGWTVDGWRAHHVLGD